MPLPPLTNPEIEMCITRDIAQSDHEKAKKAYIKAFSMPSSPKKMAKVREAFRGLQLAWRAYEQAQEAMEKHAAEIKAANEAKAKAEQEAKAPLVADDKPVDKSSQAVN
jgi:hypothetical protein